MHSLKKNKVYKNIFQITVIALTSTILFANPTQTQKEPSVTKSPLKLKVAGYNLPRLAALFSGKVKIKGCDVEMVEMGIGDMNTNVFNGPQTLDVTEIGLHPYMLAYANDNFRDYTLLPIFPLRVYRHKSIFIRPDRGIEKPEDIKGKTIATPGYSSTSLTWIRGILQDEYGVSPQDVKWITSAKDSSANLAGKISKNEQIIPEGISIHSGSKGKDESDLLVSGEADALFHAAEPKAYVEGNPNVTRLFEDYRKVERTYYTKTGIFPIMHAVAIKKSLLKEHPWLAKAVFDAYSKSKELEYEAMAKKGCFSDMLPWYPQEFTDTRKLMGKNFYSYGLDDANRKVLETLFRYSYEQGLASRKLTVEELFDPLGHSLIEEK